MADVEGRGWSRLSKRMRGLTGAERRVTVGFERGEPVDLRDLAEPVRAGVLADLLTGCERPGRAALRLRNARIEGRLDLRNAEVAVPVRFADSTFTDTPCLDDARAASLLFTDCVLPGLRARLLELRGDLVLRGCAVTGPVDLRDARVGGTVNLDGARLAAAGEAVDETRAAGRGAGVALAGARMTVTGNLHARGGFTAVGQVWLGGATIGGTADFDGAVISNPGGLSLSADRLTVGGSLTARYGFRADGDVILIHAQVGSQLNFTNARLGSSGFSALHLGGARAGTLWLNFAEPPDGRVRLSGLTVDSIFDDPATWSAELDLIGCTYRLIVARLPSAPDEPSPTVQVEVGQRLDWLTRSPDGYAPQPYEQLADFYRRNGQDPEARRVLLAKQRRRRATLRWPGRLAGYALDGLVGYGYRTWLAGLWLVVFWAVGTATFVARPPQPRNPAEAPTPDAALQALDLLLPIINLGHDGAWKPAGWSQYVAAALVIAGWVLTTAAVAGLTRLFNR
ncbi:hypothetical protein O7627_06030 [Solwaraspora sp. WMMD1047]|uniref:hypothetical protein n=1 Tax=Solwaraspora sp. WMMD1047 TaxID=3016102 RepID=UPI0024180A00|nr:hypothetical protein [Solwaraspora sp. WMMD1047]MDG4828863.1 hypothetical protein [Solwaraspora sp. WMMD1047]